MFVLYITILLSTGPQLTMQEFSSQATCEAARKEILATLPSNYSGSHWTGPTASACLPK